MRFLHLLILGITLFSSPNVWGINCAIRVVLYGKQQVLDLRDGTRNPGPLINDLRTTESVRAFVAREALTSQAVESAIQRASSGVQLRAEEVTLSDPRSVVAVLALAVQTYWGAPDHRSLDPEVVAALHSRETAKTRAAFAQLNGLIGPDKLFEVARAELTEMGWGTLENVLHRTRTPLEDLPQLVLRWANQALGLAGILRIYDAVLTDLEPNQARPLYEVFSALYPDLNPPNRIRLQYQSKLDPMIHPEVPEVAAMVILYEVFHFEGHSDFSSLNERFTTVNVSEVTMQSCVTAAGRVGLSIEYEPLNRDHVFPLWSLFPGFHLTARPSQSLKDEYEARLIETIIAEVRTKRADKINLRGRPLSPKAVADLTERLAAMDLEVKTSTDDPAPGVTGTKPPIVELKLRPNQERREEQERDRVDQLFSDAIRLKQTRILLRSHPLSEKALLSLVARLEEKGIKVKQVTDDTRQGGHTPPVSELVLTYPEAARQSTGAKAQPSASPSGSRSAPVVVQSHVSPEEIWEEDANQAVDDLTTENAAEFLRTWFADGNLFAVAIRNYHEPERVEALFSQLHAKADIINAYGGVWLQYLDQLTENLTNGRAGRKVHEQLRNGLPEIPKVIQRK